MDLNAALDVIEVIDGASVDLGDHEPTYPDFAREEHGRRYTRLAALMEDRGLDALVLTGEESIRYLTGYNSVIWVVGRWLPCALLATRNPRDAVLLPSAFDLGAVAGSAWVPTVDGHGDPTELPGKIAGHLQRLGIDADRVATEAGLGSIVMLPWPVARDVVDVAGGGRHDAQPLVAAVRMLKSDAELDRIRALLRATTAGYRAGLEAAKGGMTEKELVAIVAATMHEHGATAGTRPTFLNCVAGADRYPLVDSPASDRPMREGDVVFLDGGGGRDGYMSDIIRLIAVGDIGEELEGYATLAQESHETMLAAARPGISASELFDVGRKVFADAGHGEHTAGVSGHGIGMDLWERPILKTHDDPDEDVRLRAGMTLCIEPILLPPAADGLAGIFVYEQQIHVTADGPEVLSGDLEATLWRAPA